jgi:hypothetical protein
MRLITRRVSVGTVIIARVEKSKRVIVSIQTESCMRVGFARLATCETSNTKRVRILKKRKNYQNLNKTEHRQPSSN